MKTRYARLLGAAFVLAAVSAMAQNKPVQPSVETRGKTWSASQDTATLPPQKNEVFRRPAIKHQPFEMLDYRTQPPRPMRANEMMPPFPDGRPAMTAGEYYKELNRIEKDLNGIGYTMRDKTNKSTLIGRTLPDTAAIERQRQDIRRRLKPITPIIVGTEPLAKPRRLKVQTLATGGPPGQRRLSLLAPVNPLGSGTAQNTTSPLATNPAGAARTGGFQTYTGTKNSGEIPGTPAYEEKLLNGQIPLSIDIAVDKSLLKNPEHFNIGLGDPSIVGAGFSAWLEHSLNGDEITMGAFANGGMSLVGQNFKLLDAAAWATSGPTRNAADGHVNVLGENLLAPFHIDQAGPINKVLDSQSKSVDQSVKFHIVVGIIPIAVSIGGRGDVGYDAVLIVKDRRVHVEFDPYVRVDGFVEAGVDIVIAGAGIYGNIVIVKDTVNVFGQMGFKGKIPPPLSEPGFPTTLNGSTLRLYDEATRPKFTSEFGADNTVELFSGSIGVYAYIYVPDCCFPPWTKLEYRHDVVSWPGIRSGPDRIFGSGEVPLYLTRPLTQLELVELKRQVDLARGFGPGVKDKLPVANTPNSFASKSGFASKAVPHPFPDAAVAKDSGLVSKSATNAAPDAALGRTTGFASQSKTNVSPNAALLSKSESPLSAPAPLVALGSPSPFATAKSNLSARVQPPANAVFNTLPTPPPKNSYTEQRLAGKLEPHSHRIGGDYATGNVTSAQICQLVCEKEAQCKSWTYVTPTGQCQLKNVVPAKIEGSCCVAGVK